MASMRRVFVIENPYASRVSRRGRRAVLDALIAGGCEARCEPTSRADHATELAAHAVNEGFDVVAVYGGDGSVMEAVAGMHGSGAVLGIIPAGTANLLAGNLRIPRNPRRAAALIAAGRHRAIDLVRLETSTGERLCAVGAGTGYDADMMALTTRAQKRRWGMAAYVGFVLRTVRIERRPVRVTVDGECARHRAASVIVANCGEILPRLLPLGREVAFDDGVLDVVVLEANGLAGMAVAVAALLAGRETRYIRRMRGTEVRVETEAPQPVQADGDLCGATPLRATVIPGGLSVVAPAMRGDRTAGDAGV